MAASDGEEDKMISSDEEEEDLLYPDTYFLPILFTLDKNDKERMWKIWAEGNTVYRLQGLVQGKKITYDRTFKGKNVGKKNETSPEEQAKQEAESKWTSQLDKGYFPKCKEGKVMVEKVNKVKQETGGHNINAGAAIRGRKSKNVSNKLKDFTFQGNIDKVIPMKAEKWELEDTNKPLSVLPKVSKYFKFDEGVYIQTKLDGWRCLVRFQVVQNEIRCILTSNSGKQYKWFEKLRKELINFVSGKMDSILDGLDGELYCHRIIGTDGEGLDDKSRFQAISKICSIARNEPHEFDDQISMVLFDLVDVSGKYDQDERFERLEKLFQNKPLNTEHIQLCKTKTIYYMEEIIDYHDEIAQQGYEGVILRTRTLKYLKGKRSLEMRKYKNFIDREYPIIDVEKDDGVDNEYFVWVLADFTIVDSSTGLPKRFKAKPKGSREDREFWYENYLEYLGKPMTVKFQDYTEDGIPRFPVAIGIRDDQ